MKSSPDHLLAQARERFAVQDYHGAVVLLEEVVESGRSFADVHHLLGLCWSLLGQTARALEAFDRALELNARYIEAHVHRGLVLNQLGRTTEAEAAFRRAMAGAPPEPGRLGSGVSARLANHHAALGEAYAEAGELAGAIEQYRRAVELGPGFHDLRHRLARLLLESGGALEAREQLERILAVQPAQREVRASLGLAHYLAGDAAAAQATWEAVLADHPGDPRILAYLAMLRRGGP